MSSTTSSTTTAQYPTEGSSFGALKYNLNEMLGWILGNPTAQDIFLYSNLAINLGTNSYYIFNQDPTQPLFKQYGTYTADPTLAGLVSNAMTYEGGIQVLTLSPADYATQFGKMDGIFGFSWFPWNVYGFTNSDGNYCVRCYYGTNDYIQVNPMCWGVLQIKAITTAKIGAIVLGIYVLLKLLYKYVMKK